MLGALLCCAATLKCTLLKFEQQKSLLQVHVQACCLLCPQPPGLHGLSGSDVRLNIRCPNNKCVRYPCHCVTACAGRSCRLLCLQPPPRVLGLCGAAVRFQPVSSRRQRTDTHRCSRGVLVPAFTYLSAWASCRTLPSSVCMPSCRAQTLNLSLHTCVQQL